MRIIDNNTIALESKLEEKYCQYIMEFISSEKLWENGPASFNFLGSFIDYEQYLLAFCLLSIEQKKRIAIFYGLPKYSGYELECLAIDGFSATIYLPKTSQIKQKKINKMAKHWLNTTIFNTVEVEC